MSRERSLDPRCAADLVEAWRTEADRMEMRGLEDPVRLLRSVADQLEDALEREGSTVLTLREAARESGYSPDHLGRLVREGKIPNAGRPRAPRVRRSDLPSKPGLPASPRPTSLRPSKVAIVRSIANQGD